MLLSQLGSEVVIEGVCDKLFKTETKDHGLFCKVNVQGFAA